MPARVIDTEFSANSGAGNVFTLMKKLLLVLVIFLFAMPAHSQVSYVVKVNGVGLGTSYTEAIRNLGKPSKNVISDGDECIGGKLRTLTYPGLKLEFHQDGKGTFYVGSFEVTSARWEVSGVKIGLAGPAIKRKFGKAEPGDSDVKGETVWMYGLTDEDGPGNLNFYFRNGKLVRISTFYIC